MADDLHSLLNDNPRWPTGLLILVGLLIGAFAGLLVKEVPVGMVAGLAVGCGIDSLLNYWLNDRGKV